MRFLLRSAAVLAALSLPLMAHADSVNYVGTVNVTDGATSVGISSFKFTDPGTLFGLGTALNPFQSSVSIDGKIAKGDTISLDVTFSAPGSGSGNIDGEVVKGLFTGKSIDWTYPAIDQIDLANGSVAYVTLEPNFFGAASTSLSSCGTRNSGDLCGTTDFSLTIGPNDPASPAPEPSSLILLGTGVLGAAGMVRRRLAV